MVIHDDAFLIDIDNDITGAIEASLFDKTDAVTLISDAEDTGQDNISFK